MFRIITDVGWGYTEHLLDAGLLVTSALRSVSPPSPAWGRRPDRLNTGSDSTVLTTMSPSYEYKTITHQVGRLRPDLNQTLDYYSRQGWRLTHFTAVPGDLRRISLQRRITQ